jgi:hypothetical protein
MIYYTCKIPILFGTDEATLVPMFAALDILIETFNPQELKGLVGELCEAVDEELSEVAFIEDLFYKVQTALSLKYEPNPSPLLCELELIKGEERFSFIFNPHENDLDQEIFEND